MSLLEVRDLVAGYGGRPVLRSASLSIERGEIVALLGANGTGKTTLLRTISGAVRATSGSVRLDGRELVGRRPDQILRMGVAHVLEGRHILTSLSVDENLLLGGQTLAAAQRQEELARLYDVFPDLARLRHLSGGALSGGQQQMLAIARALMARPQVVLLDEPSLGLSPRLVEVLGELLLTVRDTLEASFLMVEQTVWMALSLAQRVYLMDFGHVRHGGDASSLDEQTLSEAYLGGHVGAAAG